MKLLFKKNSTIGGRVLFFLLCALLLMMCDHRNSAFHRARSSFAIIVSPIHYLVNLPIDTFNWVVSDFVSKKTLVKENAKLRAKTLLLNAQLQKQFAIESENQQLRALLASSAKTVDKVSVAQLLAVSPDPFVQQIVLNQGENAKVFVGQPVLDAYGIMGQVVTVGHFTSIVMLVTDNKSAIPVQIERNGVRGLVVGKGVPGLLKLQGVTDTMDVKKGDALVTSGLGDHYPFGYPVGTIVDVNRNLGGRFVDITVKPAAHLDRSRLVLLVWTLSFKIDKTIKDIVLKRPVSRRHI
ncbi:MAG: rod shape-determining protein MreC [Gammaproteobacteria bacterium]